MKKNIFVTFLFFSSFVFPQDTSKVILDYITSEKIIISISNKVIPNKTFKKILIEEYFKMTFKEDLYEEDLENYTIVEEKFNLLKIQLPNKTNHNFSDKNIKSKTKSVVHFSNVLFSNDKDYAIFYEENKCTGLCGGGNLILMKLVGDKWILKSILYAWIA